MQTIDHYIHIGRDPDEQPKLEQSIQNRIIDILDNRKAVVNFVDTANDNLERDITQKIKIFHSLKTYVYGLASIIQYPMLNIGFKQNIIETASNCPDIDEIPIEIRDFCQSEIRNHPQWVEAQSYSEIEDVIDQFNKIQEVTQDFFQHHFLGICKKAIKEFEGQDLYRPQ